MSYYDAAKKADEAAARAQLAWRDSESPNKDAIEHLGISIKLLSEAVAELARSIGRDAP